MKKVFFKVFFTVLFGVFFGVAFAWLILKSMEPSSTSQRFAKNPFSCGMEPFLKTNSPRTVCTAIDREVRYWMGLRNIAVDYTLPKGTKFFYVTWLEFEDGKLANQHLNLNISRCANVIVGRNKPIAETILEGLNQPFREPSIYVDLLWSTDTPKFLWSANGSLQMPPTDFWMKLDFGVFGSSFEGVYKGFTVLGFATSRLNQKGEMANATSDNLLPQLADKKYVGVVVVKSFATYEDLRKDLEVIHKIWD